MTFSAPLLRNPKFCYLCSRSCDVFLRLSQTQRESEGDLQDQNRQLGDHTRNEFLNCLKTAGKTWEEHVGVDLKGAQAKGALVKLRETPSECTQTLSKVAFLFLLSLSGSIS